jgi:HEAT repeat protein
MTARLLVLAALLAAPALAAPVSPEPAAAAARLDRAAAEAAVRAPAAAAAVRDAVPVPRRDGLPRFVGAPTGPEVAAIWLDLAVDPSVPLDERVARAAAGATDAPASLVIDAFHAAEAAPVRAAIVGALRATAPAAIDGALVPALADADPDVRHVAISVLVRRADAATWLPAIHRATRDGAPAVRAAAAFGLGVHGTDADAAQVARLLQDPDATVRLKALRALERLAPTTAREAAAALVDDPDPSVARAARGL